jgi:hypothetical protein
MLHDELMGGVGLIGTAELELELAARGVDH